MENADSNEDFRANLAQLRAYKSYCDITLNVKRTIFSGIVRIGQIPQDLIV